MLTDKVPGSIVNISSLVGKVNIVWLFVGLPKLKALLIQICQVYVVIVFVQCPLHWFSNFVFFGSITPRGCNISQNMPKYIWFMWCKVTTLPKLKLDITAQVSNMAPIIIFPNLSVITCKSKKNPKKQRR